jgi:mono/diheme cytochrome c family protein
MPPYSHVLNDMEVAAVVSYLRASWGNNAPPVTR